MKKSKRLLALLLSVMLIMGAVMSVPFTASAKTVELEEVGASSLKFSEMNLLGDEVVFGNDYYSLANPEVTAKNPVYVWFDVKEAGYYVVYVKNNGMTTDDVALSVAVVDQKEKEFGSIALKDGEEGKISIKADKTARYYIKLTYNGTRSALGGNIDLKVNAYADVEPDYVDPACTVKPDTYFIGSVGLDIDKDYVFVQTANNKKYSVTIENRNDKATAFKAEVYDSKLNLLGTLTTEEEDTATITLTKPVETTSYYICVTGIDGAVGEYGLMMNEVKPVAVEVPLNEEFYDSIAGYHTEGGNDYLKFTTIDKDAYYTITVKNINIKTHSWAADNEVQVPLLNVNDEELSRVYLTEGQEKSMTKKLEPNTTYYLKVFNNYSPDTAGGNYKIQISYVLDPDKNSMANGTEWKLEEKYYGDIAARGDSDWFKITTNEATDYTFTLKNTNISTHSWSGDLQFRGTLYNDKSETLACMYMTAGKEESVRLDLEPNTEYYIEIWDPQGTTGEYNFDLSVTVIIDYEAVGMENAVELKYGEEHYDSITKWEEDNKFDYLKFTTLSEPAYYTIYAKNINIPTHSWSGDYQVQVKVINDHKEEKGRFTLGPEADGSVTMLLDTNTTYYIRINNNENNGGNYKALVTYVLDPEANAMESGKTLRIGEKYYSNIAASGDVDFFKVTTDEETDFTLVLKNISLETHSWSTENVFRAVLLNKYSENLGEVVCRTGEENSLKFELEPNTTYFIKVVDPWNTKGDYSIMFAKSMILGDADLNGKINIKDATLIQKVLAKIETLNSKQEFLGDTTEDGKLNIKDATAIQKYLAKIPTNFRVGELIVVEEEYSEPATEAPVATTVPVATTAAEVTTTPKTEPTEKPVITTTVTEPTEKPVITTTVTEPTEAPTTEIPVTTQATEATDPTEEVTSTSAATEPTEITTEAPTQIVTETQEATTESEVTTEAPEIPTETVSKYEELVELCNLCGELAQDKADYEKEAPLAKGSNELKQKKDFGFDLTMEEEYLNEYYKFTQTYGGVNYQICRGYEYSEEESAKYIEEISKAYVWFTFYSTQLHPQPSGRVIYFKNTVNWNKPHVHYSKLNGDTPISGAGVEMKRFEGNLDGNDIYYIEIPTGYNIIKFNTGSSVIHSNPIDLRQVEEDGFSLTNGKYDSSSGTMRYEVDSFSYYPFRVDY